MRKAVMPFVLSAGLLAVWAAPADAAPTRADYIAQVDPICQSFVGPETDAVKAFNKNYNRMLHDAAAGTLKRWVKQTKRTVRALIWWDQLHSNLTEQVAVVQPPKGDEAAIGTWLTDRRQSDALANSAASALNRFHFAKFLRLAGQSDRAERAGISAISGFGFQFCGVPPA